MHRGNAKTYPLRIGNGKELTPKFEGMWAYEGANLSSGVLNQSKDIKHILVKPKLPPHSIGGVVHIPNSNQVRQPPRIGGN